MVSILELLMNLRVELSFFFGPGTLPFLADGPAFSVEPRKQLVIIYQTKAKGRP